MPEVACEKTSYPDKQSALVAIIGIKKKRAKGQSKNKPVQAYKCTECNNWHLTSNSNHRQINKKIKPVDLDTKPKNRRERQLLHIRNFSSKPVHRG